MSGGACEVGPQAGSLSRTERGHFLVLESTPEMSGVGTPSLVGEIGWA